jgi:hypothetical protein
MSAGGPLPLSREWLRDRVFGGPLPLSSFVREPQCTALVYVPLSALKPTRVSHAAQVETEGYYAIIQTT